MTTDPTPAASPASQRALHDPIKADIAFAAPRRSKGRAGPQGTDRIGTVVYPIPQGTLVPCLFLDRSGQERSEVLDCRPARFTRLEFANGPISGMVRRTWIDGGMDPKGRVLYRELAPERYQEPKIVQMSKRALLED